MTVKIVGDEIKPVERILTGNWSYDHAVGDAQGGVGHPLWSLVEVYGPKGVGKSTWCTDMAGRIAAATDNAIDYGDIEMQSEKTLVAILTNAGFKGNVNYATWRKGETPNAMLERFSKKVMTADNAGIGVFDSIGAITTKAELTGDLDDRNVGERAMMTGRLVGRMLYAVSETEYARTVFLINHEHQTFGSMTKGMETSGGVKKKYLVHLRIRLTDGFRGTSAIAFDKHGLIKGRVDENRYGYNGTTFYAYMVKGQGIHIGLTNMWACIMYGLADLSTKSKPTEGTSVSMDDVKFGKLGEIYERRNDDPKFFQPFIDKLNESDSHEEAKVEE